MRRLNSAAGGLNGTIRGAPPTSSLFRLFNALDAMTAMRLKHGADFDGDQAVRRCLDVDTKGYIFNLICEHKRAQSQQKRRKGLKGEASEGGVLAVGNVVAHEFVHSVGGTVMTIFDPSLKKAHKAAKRAVKTAQKEIEEAAKAEGVANMLSPSSPPTPTAASTSGAAQLSSSSANVKVEKEDKLAKFIKLVVAATTERPTLLAMRFYLFIGTNQQLMAAACGNAMAMAVASNQANQPHNHLAAYKNPSITHALYCYQHMVSNVLASVIRSEIEKVSNFYISQSHIVCTSALLCVDAVKMWRQLTIKEKNQLRIAYRQTYSTLDMIQQYCDLNCVAIGKILKKMDKNTHQNMLEAYKYAIEDGQSLIFRMGRNSRIHKLQKILADHYGRNAMGGDHKSGLEFLDAREFVSRKDQLPTLLSLTALAGIVGTLIVMILTSISGSVGYDDGRDEWGGTLFPPGSRAENYGPYLSLIPMVVVAMTFLFSINVMVWEHFGINFAFMLELDPIFHFSGAELMRDSLMYTLAWLLCVYNFLLINAHSNLCGGWESRTNAATTGIPSTTVPTSPTTTSTTTFTTSPSPSTAATAVDNTSLAPLYFVWPLWLLIFVAKAIFNSFYFNNRKPWIAIIMKRIVTAPMTSVKFADFFIADQLTSLVGIIFEMQFYWCVWFAPKTDDVCNAGRSMSLCVLSIWPNLWRFLQCLRRYRDQPSAIRKPFPNLVNAGKYASSVAELLVWMVYNILKYQEAFAHYAPLGELWKTGARVRGTECDFTATTTVVGNTTTAPLSAECNPDTMVWMSGEDTLWYFFVCACIVSIFSQIYKYLWDIVVDAGIWIKVTPPPITLNNQMGDASFSAAPQFQQLPSVPEWRLREEKVYREWWPYKLFVVEDFILRSVWAIKLWVGPHVKSKPWMFAVWSLLEVFRRFVWNFFRVENEHVNNTEGYRATKLAPIPAKQIATWDTMADDQTEKFLKDKGKTSAEFPAIKGINLSGITKFFAVLPEREKLSILSQAYSSSQLSAAAGASFAVNMSMNAANANMKRATSLSDVDLEEDDDSTAHAPVTTFDGHVGEGKTKFFSELYEEEKVCLVLDYLKNETMNEYLARVGSSTIVERGRPPSPTSANKDGDVKSTAVSSAGTTPCLQPLSHPEDGEALASPIPSTLEEGTGPATEAAAAAVSAQHSTATTDSLLLKPPSVDASSTEAAVELAQEANHILQAQAAVDPPPQPPTVEGDAESEQLHESF
eukprot:GILI01006120.1.p1 GENE.GILI01006120.1~~GILI01006120.1.p1  ORF type:complete len:1239 (-),score=216.77 GILI01006120.1:400-4116(-)